MPNPVQLPTLPVPVQGAPAPGYSAVDVRRMALAGPPIQEGVVGSADLLVTQRAAGAGLAVDVAAGEAYVLGDSITRQGLYYCLSGSALTGATEVTVRAGDGSPRIDQVVLEVKDAQHDGSGLNLARVRIVEGTPTAGATLDNRLGAATLPPTCLRLADLLIGAAAATVPTANIRSRRPMARGVRGKRAAQTSNPAIASGAGAIVPGMEYAGEFSGGDVLVTASLSLLGSTAVVVDTYTFAMVDGVSAGDSIRADLPAVASFVMCSSIHIPVTVPAGYHRVGIACARGGAAVIGYATSRHMAVREELQPYLNN